MTDTKETLCDRTVNGRRFLLERVKKSGTLILTYVDEGHENSPHTFAIHRDDVELLFDTLSALLKTDPTDAIERGKRLLEQYKPPTAEFLAELEGDYAPFAGSPRLFKKKDEPKHIGSTLTSFLEEEGIREEVDQQVQEKIACDEESEEC